MDYIHLFETAGAFNAIYYGEDYNEPWVSYTEENNQVKYNKRNLREQPFTFSVISGGTIQWSAKNSSFTKTIQYKLNGGDWTEITSNTGDSAPTIVVNEGDVLQFRGDNDSYATGDDTYNSFTNSTALFAVDGNLMSLIKSTGFEELTELPSAYTFYGLFVHCTGLTSAGNLVLPATTMTDYCYHGMFSGCTSLTYTPELPATVMAVNCYGDMFASCTNLVRLPELPATTLAEYCYYGIFRKSEKITKAPDLPAETLADWCYQSMFSECTSLTVPPKIMATTFGKNSCNGMFRDCTSLTYAPELPTTTLTRSCYSYMFERCTGLIQAPELPATTLAQNCYFNMFNGCTSLTEAPELPATTLAQGCYQAMFYNCTNLNYVKCLATDISATNCTNNWLVGVSSTGTFVKDANMASWRTGGSGIPNGWEIQNA